jgi:ABC-2 type transport system permease protein
MKPYVSLLRARFLNGLQYRAAAIGGLATQFFWGIMLVFIYKAFYGDAAGSNGFSFKDLVSFVWLQQAFLSFVMLYDWDSEMLDMIMTGGISYELCRPVNIYQIWYVKLLSKRLSRGIMRFAPVIILGFLMPAPYNMSLPQSPVSFLLFLVTLFLGLFLLVAISMLIYISIFSFRFLMFLNVSYPRNFCTKILYTFLCLLFKLYVELITTSV